MTRTKRIYNNPRIKAPRYNLDDGLPHIIHGIPFTKRSWICMGRCPECSDPKKEPKAVRRKNKEDLRLRLRQEEITNDTI